ncbi:thioredoxin fold domain-containing protein [Piscinibacter sp. XHJ-5]|uniref:thioredoxin fold domain-containing protein n=1 Tax=Piscinibacter sp. XHJ-5 TaxID=3037797 RepID=UPI0024535E00|nr:thioredoxin fold domain-containing protein [Piscinibacter sp. XHJ-5]
MNRRRFLCRSSATALAALAVAACGDKAATPAAATPSAQKPAPKDAYEMAGRASGFTVGSMMAANTVYVFFDPTCPHCATLWTQSKPLATKLKMVWIPIGWLQKSSAPQAATILSARDPAAAMAENEASVLERRGGITVASSLSDEALARVKANTELFNKIGEESVPLIVFKNGKTGDYGVHAGVVPSEQLAAMVGM